MDVKVKKLKHWIEEILKNFDKSKEMTEKEIIDHLLHCRYELLTLEEDLLNHKTTIDHSEAKAKAWEIACKTNRDDVLSINIDLWKANICANKAIKENFDLRNQLAEYKSKEQIEFEN